jgi:hypothetical protein
VLIGYAFLIAAFRKLSPIEVIPERDVTALGTSPIATTYNSYEKAPKSSARRTQTALLAGLRKAKHAPVWSDIYPLATTGDEADMKGEDTSLGLVVEGTYLRVEDHARL